MAEVTDPDLLRRLNAPDAAPTQVTDPELLRRLNAPRDALETATGYGRALASGLSEGAGIVAGAPADIGRLAQKGVSFLQSKVQGIPYEEALARNDANAVISPETLARYGSEAINRRAAYGYEPESGGEALVKNVASYVPGAVLGPGGVARNVAAGAVSGLAAEGAGELARNTVPALETPAKIAAAVLAPMAARGAFTQGGAARAPFVQALQAEGVPLAAGEVSGSRALRGAEKTLGGAVGSGGAVEHASEATTRGVQQAVARRLGEDATTLGPDVMARASDRIGQQFRDLSARNTLQYDPQMGAALQGVAHTYGQQLDALQLPVFQRMLGSIQKEIIQGGGSIPGEVYQNTRSTLSRRAQAIRESDPLLAEAYRGLRGALDDAMARSIRPEDAAAWNTARQQYANMKTVESALPDAMGNVSPASLVNAVVARNRPGYVRGRTDLGEFARAANAVIDQAPARSHASSHAISLASGLATAIPTMISTGNLKTALLGPLAALGPGLAGRALMSTPVQWALRNRPYAEDVSALARLGQAARQGYLASSPAPEGR